MARPTVLILGGYGIFGRRIAANLARRDEIDLVIAGRNAGSAATLARALGAARVSSLGVDLQKPDAISRLLKAKPAIIVDTIGPFQSRNLALPRRCAELGIHYVDIADARTRVTEIASLDAVARVGHAAIISGASTLPALTTAIVDELASNPREVVVIEVGISASHRAPGGVATAAAILGSCGAPIPPVCGSREEYGWGDLTRHAYPAPVGERWLSNLDSPERAIWRKRYPALEEAAIRGGLEIGILHLGLAGLSRGVRIRVLPQLSKFAKPFLKFATLFDGLASQSGAMHVRVVTRDQHARPTTHNGGPHRRGRRLPADCGRAGNGRRQETARPAGLCAAREAWRLPVCRPPDARGDHGRIAGFPDPLRGRQAGQVATVALGNRAAKSLILRVTELSPTLD